MQVEKALSDNAFESMADRWSDKMHYVAQAPTLDDIVKRYNEIFAGMDYDDDDEEMQLPAAVQQVNRLRSALREAHHQKEERRPQVRLPRDHRPTESDVSFGSTLRSV